MAEKISILYNEEDITTTNNHVPASFKLGFIAAYADVLPNATTTTPTTTPASNAQNSTVVNLSDVFEPYIKEIVIDKEVGEIDKATIKMEYSVTADSYKNNSGKYGNNTPFPPWTLFQKNYLKDLKFTISYTLLASTTYYYRVSKYNFGKIADAKKTQLQILNNSLKTRKKDNTSPSASIGTYNPNNAAASVKNITNEVDKVIKDYVREVSKVIKDVEESISPEYQIATKDAILFSGVPVVHSFKGGENGMVEFEVTMHTKLTANDSSVTNNASTYSFLTNTEITKGVFITEQSYLAMVNDIIYGYQITFEEFAAALFGLVKDGDKYKVGLRQIQYRDKKYKLVAGGADITPDHGTSTTAQSEANNFNESLIKNRIVLSFSYLSDIYVKDLFVGFDRAVDTNKMVYYAKSNTPEDDAYTAINDGITKSTGRLAKASDIDTLNKISVMTQMLERYKAFLKYVTGEGNIADQRESQSYLVKYLNGVSKSFNLLYMDRKFDKDLVNHIAMYSKKSKSTPTVLDSSRPAPPPGKPVEEEKFVVMLDYGGAVVNFQHTVRPDPVKSAKNAGAKTKIIDIPNDEGLTLQFEVDQAAVDTASEQLYKATPGALAQKGINYYQALQNQIKQDPDAFLNKFTRLIGTSSGQIQQISDSTGVNAVGGQKLTLNLRHPIPSLSYNSTIYFYGAGEITSPKNFQENATLATKTQPGFYIVPPNIRGVYIVTKMTNTFNAKENIWTQRLECSR